MHTISIFARSPKNMRLGRHFRKNELKQIQLNLIQLKQIGEQLNFIISEEISEGLMISGTPYM